jgi:hypothetical protein
MKSRFAAKKAARREESKCKHIPGSIGPSAQAFRNSSEIVGKDFAAACFAAGA